MNDLLFKSKYKFDGKSLSKIIYKNIIEKDRFAFSSVWVNESKDVLEKVHKILKDDKLSTQRNISIKYSATVYQDKYKYTINYKKFLNRSERIADFKKERLLRIENLEVLSPIKDIRKILEMKKMVEEYNNIKPITRKSQKEIMKEYFNLMGYKI